MTECKIPSNWKSSSITMIAKKANGLDNMSNYRPISVTNCLMRLLERLILARLQKHLKKYNLITKVQSGFRPNRSTQDNLSFMSQKASESIEKQGKTLAIIFEIASAFDKVYHNGLMVKLAKLKVPYYLLMIIKEFLLDRTLTVRIGNAISREMKITCGVLQRVVLSPTLFSVHMLTI